MHEKFKYKNTILYTAAHVELSVDPNANDTETQERVNIKWFRLNMRVQKEIPKCNS